MLKITRRPYQACAYRWALSTSGISVGEGDCSESQCAELNGEFVLDFSACASRHGKLVWAGDCEGNDDLAGACGGRYRLDVSGVSGFDCANTYNGSFTMQAVSPKVACTHCLYATKRRSSGEDVVASSCECEPLGNEPLIEYGFVGGGYTLPGALFWFYADDAESCVNFFGSHSGTLYANATGFPVYNKTSGIVPSAAIGDTVVFTRGTDSACGHTWPETITATCLATGVAPADTGPETNDRIRSKWHLEYDIEATLWTLRSFNRIDYPVYTLLDASPCDGDTKTLLLADKGDAADGCGVAPAEMTITRVCPPDRVGKSALLEDRNPNGATGKRKRQCGCDCRDEVDDRRQCATKCGDPDGGGGACDLLCPCYEELEWEVGGFINPTSNVEPGHWPTLRKVQSFPDFVFTDCLNNQSEKSTDFGYCGWGDHSNATFLNGENKCALDWRAHLGSSADLATCNVRWTFRFQEYAQPLGSGCLFTATYASDTTSSDGCGLSAMTMTLQSASDTATCYGDSVPETITLTPTGGCSSGDCGGDTGGPYNTNEGCENYPDEPATSCRYPEAINCCEHTAGKDVSCAYTVEFECDLFFDIESVRHKIAAKQVTLRRECYFENPCRFVAVGAESSTGGSPVMDVDGFPGAQPVCASCADDCLTGCTWSAWTVAECPEPPLPCGPNMCDTTTTFTMDIPVTIGTGDVPCTSAHSVTLLHTGTKDDRWTVDGMSFPSSPPPAGQVEIAMQLHENCVTLSLYRTWNIYDGAGHDCGLFGPVTAAYSGTPESGDCPAEFVFTRKFGSSSAFPSTLTATRV